MRHVNIRDDQIGAAFDLPHEPMQASVRKVTVAREQHEMRPVMIDYQAERSRMTDDGRRPIDRDPGLVHGLGEKLDSGGARKNDPLRGDRQIQPRELCSKRCGRVG